MKKFLLCILLYAGLINAATADSAGVYFEPARNGEGAAIFTQDDTFAAFIYTYRDNDDSLPPVVGPSPPRVGNRCTNATTWYVAQATNFDGSTASGVIYSGEAIEFPFAFDDSVAAVESVGTFTAAKVGKGWDISITYSENPLVDQTDSLYSLDFQFRVPLIN
jgi:hypothetical protein